MKKRTILFFLSLLISLPTFSQSFFSQTIKNVPPTKKSAYSKNGIFFSSAVSQEVGHLSSVRHFYSKNQGYERVVFDFKGAKVPQIYSFFSSEKRKVYIDFFNSKLNPNIKSLGNGKLVKNLIFYPLSDEVLSLEIDLTKELECEIFYLENPGRIVLDIKS